MSALLRKEVRLLWPSWLVGVLVVTSIWGILPFHPSVPLASLPLILGAAMPFLIASNSIGRELNLGTFSGLLGSPVPRARLWWTKVSVLAVALVLLLVLWLLAFGGFATATMNRPEADLFDPLIVILFWLAAYSGGLWTALVFRQMAAGWWFALLVPVVILTTIEMVFDRYPDMETAKTVVTSLVFLLYAIGSFAWACRLFLRAQDVHWTGGTISLPDWRISFARSTSRHRKHARRPWRALLAKELHLHHGQLLLAGLLLLLHLLLLGIRNWTGPAKNFTVLQFIFQSFWGLWLILPLLISGVAVADERKLGTLDGAACLPVSRRRQFSVKLAVVLLLGCGLGAVMPWLLEGNEGTIGPAAESGGPAWWLAVHGLVTLFAIALFISLLSFYASTLARNALQAFGLAVATIIVVVSIAALAAQPESMFELRLWRGPLFYWIGCLVGFGTLLPLAYWNFKRGHVGQKLWRRNTIVLSSALAFSTLVTTALYHRTWEKFISREPEHGPARLKLTDAIAKSTSVGGSFCLLLPAGHLSFYRLYGSYDWGPFGDPILHVDSADLGTNWVSAASLWAEDAAIRSDGTLWVSERPSRPRRTEQGTRWDHAQLIPVGDQTNWQQILSIPFDRGMMLLLSRDGALWSWGRRDSPIRSKPISLKATEPSRFGNDSDWARLISTSVFATYCQKRDGTMWTLDWQTIQGRTPTLLRRSPELDGADWQSLAQCFPFLFGVKDDGSLWGWEYGMMPTNLKGLPASLRALRGGKAQIDPGPNWKAVAGQNQDLLALKTDGTLWHWDFGIHSSPAQLGTKSDWVAIVTTMGWSVATLAADGSLWQWESDTPFRQSPMPFLPLPYLGPSRLPKRVGNLFDAETVQRGK